MRSRWTAWAAATLEIELVRGVIDQLERINAIASTLYEAGEINRVEHRLLQLELATRKVLATEINLELLQEEIALLSLMGLSPENAYLELII